AETFLFHKQVAQSGLMMRILDALKKEDVELRVDKRVCEYCPDCDDHSCNRCEKTKPATEDDWSEEYLEKTVAVGVVDSLDQAIDHINRYGSKHTDAIVTSAVDSAESFINRVDSANVFVNCSTRFS